MILCKSSIHEKADREAGLKRGRLSSSLTGDWGQLSHQQAEICSVFFQKCTHILLLAQTFFRCNYIIKNAT